MAFLNRAVAISSIVRVIFLMLAIALRRRTSSRVLAIDKAFQSSNQVFYCVRRAAVFRLRTRRRLSQPLSLKFSAAPNQGRFPVRRLGMHHTSYFVLNCGLKSWIACRIFGSF